VKVCDKTCIFFFFPIINKYFLMAKGSLLSRCTSYVLKLNTLLLVTFISRLMHSIIQKDPSSGSDDPYFD